MPGTRHASCWMPEGGQPGTEINVSQMVLDAFFVSFKNMDLTMSAPFLLGKKNKVGYIIGSFYSVLVSGRK